MYTAEDFRTAWEDYVEFNRKLLDGVTPLGSLIGVFGFGKRPGSDPGHEKFLTEMENALKQTAGEHPDPETAGEILEVIFDARHRYEEEKISPYLFSAVEGMTMDMIPFLSKEKAQALYGDYQKIPYKLRVPVTRKVLAALKQAARQ